MHVPRLPQSADQRGPAGLAAGHPARSGVCRCVVSPTAATLSRELSVTSLYIGDRVAHGSDRAALERVLSLLGRDKRDAVVLANVNLGGRQIDLIVGLEEMALVIEAKGHSRPIRGGRNGLWQYQAASGDWVNFRNPYLQALDAKNKVRDAMGSIVGSEGPVPGCGRHLHTGHSGWLQGLRGRLQGLSGRAE